MLYARILSAVLLLVGVLFAWQPAQSISHGLSCGINVDVAYGDSITFGSSAGGVGIAGSSYVVYANVQPTSKYNGGVPGAGMTGTGSDPGWTNLNAITASLISSRCNSANVIVSELFGFNDFTIGRTTTEFLNSVSAWADLRRTAGAKVICISLLPSTDASAPTYNAWRNTVNTTLVTWAPGGGGTQHCDGLADFGADPTMGPDSAPNNTMLYADKLHPLAAGHQILAPIYQVVVRALMH